MSRFPHLIKLCSHNFFIYGKFFLPTYGFLVSMGVLIGLWISVRNSERLGIDGDKAWNLGILVVLCGIVGAKVLYVINEWSYYSAHPSEIFSINTLQAGGVFSGGLLAAFIAAAWYVWKHHMPALGTCDAFAPGLALGHAIGRIGCFAAGCCYGKDTHHWWGVVFHNPLANYHHRDAAGHSARTHPAVRVGRRAGEFLLPHVAAQAQKIRRPGHSARSCSSTASPDSSSNISATIPAAARSSAAP